MYAPETFGCRSVALRAPGAEFRPNRSVAVIWPENAGARRRFRAARRSTGGGRAGGGSAERAEAEFRKEALHLPPHAIHAGIGAQLGDAAGGQPRLFRIEFPRVK